MAIYTNEELLEQLRAIGWRDRDIARDYPDLLPEFEVHTKPAPSTLYERLIMIGWTDEEIRTQHPEILPEEEGGILETVGEPVYTLGEKAGEPVVQPEPVEGSDAVFVADPDGYQAVPSVASNQTADLMLLGLIFL